MSEEWKPLLMLAVPSGDSFIGNAETVEAEMEPFADQLAFGDGDSALIAMSQVALEADFVVCRGVDAQEYAASFPDWAERVEHHALCELFSRTDQELSVGWVARLKLMPIPGERYTEMQDWLTDGWPEELPDWIEEIYKAFTQRLSEIRPDIAPVLVQCPFCHGDEVAMVVERTIAYRCRVGTVQVDGEPRHVPITDVDENQSHTARLVCVNSECQATGTLEDGEWMLPGISN